MKVLLSWLGSDELPNRNAPLRPLTEALRVAGREFKHIYLLNNLSADDADAYLRVVSHPTRITVLSAPLSSPVDYGEIHGQAVKAVERVRAEVPGAELTFFLNSGTPPMGSVWLLLGKSKFPAKLLAWSNYHKTIEHVDVPFEISAEFAPLLFDQTDAALRASSAEPAPVHAAFKNIVGQCAAMRDLLARARTVALHNVPIVLEGESGTGKEILARAIHDAGPRSKKPFVPVNCGAIAENLAESEFFGHVKGSFTGATRDREGHFREANGGILFLDEIGDLPLTAQVKLLRPLQEQEIVPVGASKPVRVDVQIIAATHRSLLRDVADGRFREDLFFRLAVAMLRVPALREREGDKSLLIDYLLEGINGQNRKIGIAERSLSPSARNVLLHHDWPGNVRELANTIRRAAVWSSKSALDAIDIEKALLPRRTDATSATVLDRPLGAGFDLDGLLREVEQHYVARALELTKGKKVEAARLLGFKSHQVLNNRISGNRRRRN